MTNKEYRNAREMHENANELFTYEKYNGWHFTRAMNADDMRELRAEYKADKRRGAFALDGCNGRAVVFETGAGAVLKSYQTIVAAIEFGADAELLKIWGGYSVTTAKHIKAFCARYGIPAPNKREWIEMGAGAVNENGVIISTGTGIVLFDEIPF